MRKNSDFFLLTPIHSFSYRSHLQAEFSPIIFSSANSIRRAFNRLEWTKNQTEGLRTTLYTDGMQAGICIDNIQNIVSVCQLSHIHKHSACIFWSVQLVHMSGQTRFGETQLHTSTNNILCLIVTDCIVCDSVTPALYIVTCNEYNVHAKHTVDGIECPNHQLMSVPTVVSPTWLVSIISCTIHLI